ncbi:MAG: adenylate/guanylate cyclase domain-containing protein [Oligoflexales bacterium]|nr:adenylate/guanylate cyclase domain-containing protein [Oligoflexales bacterium]
MVDKFMGDCVMAIFGAPEEMIQDTQIKKAVECAMAMQAALNELNQRWLEKGIREFSMRIGIHAGSGIVGSFGSEMRAEYTVIGPIVNLASRIEKAAGPGDIYFSAVVRDHLESGGWVRVGTFNLKGIGDTALFKIKRGYEAADKVKKAA